jgi:hypothetical protein
VAVENGWRIIRAMRKLILMLILFVACLPLMSCATGSRTMGETAADTLPTWMGGLPSGVPPRRGTPEYDAWKAERARLAAEAKTNQ